MIDFAHKIDAALWRLPIWARVALVAPVGIVCAGHDGWIEGRREFLRSWRFFMDYARRGVDAL